MDKYGIIVEEKNSVLVEDEEQNYWMDIIKKYSSMLESVPEELKTKEFCEIAVKKDGGDLKHVPEELKTQELCKIAVENNHGWALEYVPEEFQAELAEKYDIPFPAKGQSR